MMPFVLLAIEPPSPDYLGDVLKVAQICFYIIAGIVAILTYWAAIRGWLTPTNTEYQKRVMDRLAKLAEDLYSKFDPTSENYWPNRRIVHNVIDGINAIFERDKDELLAERKWYYGSPVTKDVQRLSTLLDPIRSDPFIPENIRAEVVDLLENRIYVLQGLYFRESEKYADNLVKGKHPPLTELDDVNKIHNRIVDRMNQQGCGIQAIENAVHDIRALIQDYFDAFNPHGIGKGKRKRFAMSADPQD